MPFVTMGSSAARRIAGAARTPAAARPVPIRPRRVINAITRGRKLRSGGERQLPADRVGDVLDRFEEAQARHLVLDPDHLGLEGPEAAHGERQRSLRQHPFVEPDAHALKRDIDDGAADRRLGGLDLSGPEYALAERATA